MKTRVRVAIVLESAAAAVLGTAGVSIWITAILVESMIQVLKLF